MKTYLILLIVFIFLGHFSVLLSANAQSSSQPLSESSGTSEGTSEGQTIANNIIEKSLKKIAVVSRRVFLKIFDAFKDFIRNGLKWLKEITLPRVKEYFQVKKSEVQEELKKEKEELKGEIKEYLSKISLMLWQWLKNSAKDSIK